MKQTINIDVNSINKKALMWWKQLSKDWKLTMLHNPRVNKSINAHTIPMVSKSTSMIRRMFINWLTWEMGK